MYSGNWLNILFRDVSSTPQDKWVSISACCPHEPQDLYTSTNFLQTFSPSLPSLPGSPGAPGAPCLQITNASLRSTSQKYPNLGLSNKENQSNFPDHLKKSTIAFLHVLQSYVAAIIGLQCVQRDCFTPYVCNHAEGKETWFCTHCWPTMAAVCT